MDDLISRQAAIDVLNTVYSEWQTQEACSALEEATSMIEGLPPAQPETVRCKDCLMHGVCRFELGLGLDGYCSQAERKEE